VYTLHTSLVLPALFWEDTALHTPIHHFAFAPQLLDLDSLFSFGMRLCIWNHETLLTPGGYSTYIKRSGHWPGMKRHLISLILPFFLSLFLCVDVFLL
jgi:hypothetical protein